MCFNFSLNNTTKLSYIRRVVLQLRTKFSVPFFIINKRLRTIIKIVLKELQRLIRHTLFNPEIGSLYLDSTCSGCSFFTVQREVLAITTFVLTYCVTRYYIIGNAIFFVFHVTIKKLFFYHLQFRRYSLRRKIIFFKEVFHPLKRCKRIKKYVSYIFICKTY